MSMLPEDVRLRVAAQQADPVLQGLQALRGAVHKRKLIPAFIPEDPLDPVQAALMQRTARAQPSAYELSGLQDIEDTEAIARYVAEHGIDRTLQEAEKFVPLLVRPGLEAMNEVVPHGVPIAAGLGSLAWLMGGRRLPGGRAGQQSGVIGYRGMNPKHGLRPHPDSGMIHFAPDSQSADRWVTTGREKFKFDVDVKKVFDFRKKDERDWLIAEMTKPENLTEFNRQTKKLMGPDYTYEADAGDIIGGIEEGAYQVFEVPVVAEKIKQRGYDGIYMVEEGEYYAEPNLAIFDPNKAKSIGPAPGAMPSKQGGWIGGVNSKTADLDELAQAQEMTAHGKNRDEIFAKTGWFKDRDGWKYENPDIVLGIKDLPPEAEAAMAAGRPWFMNLDEYYENPDLYAAYPDIAKAELALQPSAKVTTGAYTGPSRKGSERVSVGTVDYDGTSDEVYEFLQKRVATHEAGAHAVQRREGFAVGGSPEGEATKAKMEANRTVPVLDKKIDEIDARIRTAPESELDPLREQRLKLLDERNKAWDKGNTSGMPEYLNLAGEAEARNVEYRMQLAQQMKHKGMSDAQIKQELRNNPPWKTMEFMRHPVKEEDLVYRKESGASFSADEPVKALPSPKAKKIANELAREDRWQDLERATKLAGIKRSPSTGRYTGAGPEVKSPQKKAAIVRKYAERIQRALDAGIPEGYFYATGRGALESITSSPEKHRLFAELIGPTSTQVGPAENLNYAIRALEQTKVGNPVSVGLYPNSLRRAVQEAIYDEDPWKGYKVERYRNLLGPDDPRANPMSMMPPNDQWEGFGTGLSRGQVPTGPTQVAFSDHIRELALDKVNKQRIAEGKPRLTLPEAQELHWAAIRAETDGRPLQLNPGDTLQGSIPGQTFQHSWEAAPGPSSGVDLGPIDIQTYTDAVANELLDLVGKDKLIEAMGGELQLPAIRGTGVYKGETAPGIQSRSLVSQTQARGLSEASRKRVDATEAIRQFILAQEGRAGHSLLPAKRAKDIDTINVDIGGIPTEKQTIEIEDMVNRTLGMDDNGWPRAGIVFTEKGYRILNISDMPNAEFSKKIKAIAKYLDNVAEIDDMAGARRESIYSEFDWQKGGVTAKLMFLLDKKKFPGIKRMADSPEVRAVMGDVANLYDGLRAAGLKPNEKLVNVLRTWSTDGLEGVRAMVDKGLAPAAVLGVLAAYGEQQDERAL